MKIFVYGTLKQGFGLHRMLEGSRYLGLAHTTAPFALLDSGFPVLTPMGCGNVVVEGEVYDVPEELVPRLDRIESAYNREQHEVAYAEDNGTGSNTDVVWMYVGKPSRWHYNNRLGIQWYDPDTGVFCFGRDEERRREADHVDGYDRDDLGESPDY
jgi:gamma-glutamylcyclotransferase (GGCT)/AIG2-like uncharacterized protein YtfP